MDRVMIITADGSPCQWALNYPGVLRKIAAWLGILTGFKYWCDEWVVYLYSLYILLIYYNKKGAINV